MKLQPIYKGKDHRIAYCANNRWQYQRRIGAGNREHDPWIGIAGATTFENAKSQLESRTPHAA
jgi:hypothetical protein